ncbi:MAG: PD-(D/E)XK nuclease family protein [Thermoplasmatales archaeon]
MVNAEYISRLFIDAILNEINSKPRDDAVHVSAMSYGCPRYLKFLEETGTVDIFGSNADNWTGDDGLFRVWIGTKLHETSITTHHEFMMKYEYKNRKISGTIDEIVYDGDEIVIIDKKFTRILPDDIYEHHRNQVMFYAAIYRKKFSESPTGISLIYFLPVLAVNNGERFRVFYEPITDADIDKYEKMMFDLIDGMDEYRKHESFFCKFCPFKMKCTEMK